MRAFIAIELSPELKDSIAVVQSHLKYSGADVKWIETGNIHLTLKFLGDITDEACEKIRSILDDIGRSAEPFDIGINGVAAFPNINFPRVIWIGLDKGAIESKKLAAKIEKETSKIGIQKEARPFAPHLTIGRVRSPKNKEALKERICTAQLPVTKSHFVSSVSLFQSTLSSKGPTHTKLYESRLSCSQEL